MFSRLRSMFREYNATLNGWRFDDVKKYMESKLQNSVNSPIAERYSLDLAESPAQSGRRPKLCLISNFPPEDTGIATCSLHSWATYQKDIDIFCPVVDVDWFLLNARRLANGSGGRINLYDQSVFMAIAGRQDYDAVIIALGNSVHCFYVHEILKKIETVGLTGRTLLHVHDPCLLHMIQRGVGLSNGEFYRTLRNIYRKPDFATDHDAMPDWALWQRMIEVGMLGMRYFANLGVKGFLFNSKAAIELARRDLGDSDAFVAEVFHPVFALAEQGRPEIRGAQDHDLLSVGTFGVPGSSKCTLEIAEAVALLRKQGRRVRLLIAGFQAKPFFASHRHLLTHDDTEIFDGPTDKQLVEAMATVDVAVQLRRSNLGESSGVVPLLLDRQVPTIVAAVGAFREYGEAVVMIPEGSAPSVIRDAILATASAPPSPAAMAAYATSHAPAVFHARIDAIVGEWARQRRG